MKIIVIGAGQTGATISKHLASEDNHITIIDIDKVALLALQDKIDVRTIQGNGSYPYVLKQADASEADLILAVTDKDEVNMAVCQIAYTLFGVKRKIARIRSPYYTSHKKLFKDQDLPIDQIITPELILTNNIVNLIKYPGVSQVINFKKDLVKVLSIKIKHNNRFIGKTLLSAIVKFKSNVEIATLCRKGEYLPITSNIVFELHDEIFFIVKTAVVRKFLGYFNNSHSNYKSIMIAGGGNIGQNLSRKIEHDYRVKLIDHNHAHCQQAASTLEKTIVIEGTSSNVSLLLEENIDETDVFCAVTNSDENNILSAALAKSNGAKTSIAVVNNPSYIALIKNSGLNIDILVSTDKVAINSILAVVRSQYATISRAHSLQDGHAEFLELEVNKVDDEPSFIMGKELLSITISDEFYICALMRGNEIFLRQDNPTVCEKDVLIILLTNKHKISKLKKYLAPLS